MANWKYRIDIKKILDKGETEFGLTHEDDVLPEEFKKEIIAELKKAPFTLSAIKEVEDSIALADLNVALEDIYDQADNKLIWCGF